MSCRFLSPHRSLAGAPQRAAPAAWSCSVTSCCKSMEELGKHLKKRPKTLKPISRDPGRWSVTCLAPGAEDARHSLWGENVRTGPHGKILGSGCGVGRGDTRQGGGPWGAATSAPSPSRSSLTQSRTQRDRGMTRRPRARWKFTAVSAASAVSLTDRAWEFPTTLLPSEGAASTCTSKRSCPRSPCLIATPQLEAAGCWVCTPAFWEDGSSEGIWERGKSPCLNNCYGEECQERGDFPGPPFHPFPLWMGKLRRDFLCDLLCVFEVFKNLGEGKNGLKDLMWVPRQLIRTKEEVWEQLPARHGSQGCHPRLSGQRGAPGSEHGCPKPLHPHFVRGDGRIIVLQRALCLWF